MKTKVFISALCLCALSLSAQNEVKPPIMGWSSWNNYRININEDIVKAQADAMVSNGMSEVGYQFINTDDGYFGGRDADGRLLINSERFPSGIKSLADYIHSKGLKAGIYSDAGYNTCGCAYDADTISVGCGLLGHEWADLKYMLDECGFDFIKVDWCGGEKLGMDEESRYRYIIDVVRKVKPEVVFNVCRWQFPGKWVSTIADSWRVSGDITDRFESITHIIDLNADLWRYCTPGHYNDMDMLQVGRGMTNDEDKAHFSMWCMMVSPLLAGNDLTTMSKETLDILTNQEMIAINQDPLFYQARRLRDDGDLELWAKPMRHTMSGDVAVALLNRSETPQNISFKLDEIGLIPADGYIMRDIWEKKDYATTTAEEQSFMVAPHSVVVLRIKGSPQVYNVFQHQ